MDYDVRDYYNRVRRSGMDFLNVVRKSNMLYNYFKLTDYYCTLISGCNKCRYFASDFVYGSERDPYYVQH